MQNEKDWNVADNYRPHQRLYVKRAPSRVPVIINNTIVHLPESMLEDAYVLDDGGEIDEGYTLIRIPNYNNSRGKVKNVDIVFFTETMPEQTYTNRIEIGDLFRYKDASSHIEEEVEDAPEWLNNICNRIDALEVCNRIDAIEICKRIDALEAQVEMLEPENFRNLVMSLIESPAFAHMVFNTVRQQSIRYQNSQKTLKELWDSNTPLYYRDKGWR